jgi:multiple sugar transport system substrate-binding protein
MPGKTHIKPLIFPILFTTLVLASLLAACFNRAPTQTANPGESAASDNSANLSPGLDVSGGQPVTITFTSYDFYQPMFEDLIAEFQRQNPSITVQYMPIDDSGAISQSEDDYFARLASAADTAMVGGRSRALGAYFLDLQPQIDADLAFDANDFWPGSLSACQDELGQVLGVPLSLYYSGIFYDRAAFAAAGLPEPQPGWTWDEFRRDVASLTATLDGQVRYGFADRSFLSVLEPLVNAGLSNANGQVDAQNLSDALQWYVDLAQAGQLLPLAGVTDTTQEQAADEAWQELFSSGRPPAMWYGRLIEPLPGLAGNSEDSDPATHLAVNAYGLAPLPVSADGSDQDTTALSGVCAAISAGSPHPQAAWQWISFLSHQRLLDDRSQSSDLLKIPARQSVAEQSGFWDDLPAPAGTAVRYGLEHAWYPGLYAQAEKAVYAAVENAVSGRVRLTDALAAVQTAPPPAQASGRTAVIVATPQPTANPLAETAGILFYSGYFTRDEQAAVKTLVQQFNQEHQDEFKVTLDDAYPQSSSASYLASFSGMYDCYLSDISPADAAASGAVLGLTSLFENEEPDFRQDFDPELLAKASYEGELYSLPYASDPPIIAYNADLLARRGIDLPRIGWAFTDFLQAVTAASSSTPDDPSYGLLLPSDSLNAVELFLAGLGAHWLEPDGDTPQATFTNPDVAPALTNLAQLYTLGALYQGPDSDDWYNVIAGQMASGQIAFWSMRAGEQNTLFFAPSTAYNFTVGTAVLPALPAGSTPLDLNLHPRNFVISAQSKSPQGCWAWYKFLSLQPGAVQSLPARASLANSAAWEASVGTENAQVYRNSATQAAGQPATSLIRRYYTAPLSSFLSIAIRDVVDGLPASQALNDAQRKADAYRTCALQSNLAGMNAQQLLQVTNDCAHQANPQNS